MAPPQIAWVNFAKQPSSAGVPGVMIPLFAPAPFDNGSAASDVGIPAVLADFDVPAAAPQQPVLQLVFEVESSSVEVVDAIVGAAVDRSSAASASPTLNISRGPGATVPFVIPPPPCDAWVSGTMSLPCCSSAANRLNRSEARNEGGSARTVSLLFGAVVVDFEVHARATPCAALSRGFCSTS